MDTNTNKILSFEEFSTGTATAERPAETKVDNTEVVDTETTDTEAETEEVEDTETEEVEDTETEEVEESEEEEVEESKTVAEMVQEMKEAMENEAKAYEADEYDEHTVESYMKEKAALDAKAICEALESCKGVDEAYTKEAYEAACSTIKETFAKKVDEVCEAYESENRIELEDKSPESAVISEPIK